MFLCGGTGVGRVAGEWALDGYIILEVYLSNSSVKSECFFLCL